MGEELSSRGFPYTCTWDLGVAGGLVACPSLMSVFLSWMYAGAEQSPQRPGMDPPAHADVSVAAAEASRQGRTTWPYGWEVGSREGAPGLQDAVQDGGQWAALEPTVAQG